MSLPEWSSAVSSTTLPAWSTETLPAALPYWGAAPAEPGESALYDLALYDAAYYV